MFSNLSTIYIYQCSPLVADYARLHDRFISYLRQNVGCRFLFPESIAELRRYVPNLKLPQSTLSMDEDAKTFQNALKNSRQKQVSMNVQVNSDTIKISTAERVRLFAGCLLHVVETFQPEEIDEIQLDAEKNEICLVLHCEPVPVILTHPDSNQIFESLSSFREKVKIVQRSSNRGNSVQDFNGPTYHSKSFLSSRISGNVPIKLKDVSAFILTASLSNLSSGVPTLQAASMNLIASLCHRFELHLENDPQLTNLLKVTSQLGTVHIVKSEKLFSPVWSDCMVIRLSSHICASASWLLLDFIAACSYFIASESLLPHFKMAVCAFLQPWLKRLPLEDKNGSLNDAIASLCCAFTELPTNSQLIDSVFTEMNHFFDTIFENLLTIVCKNPSSQSTAVLILLKAAKKDSREANSLFENYMKTALLQRPSKIVSGNNRMLFVVRVINTFLVEGLIGFTNENSPLYYHFALSLFGSGLADGDTVYSLLFNLSKMLMTTTGEAQNHRLLNELCEQRFTDIFFQQQEGDFGDSSPSVLVNDSWFSLLELTTDLLSSLSKESCVQWSELCRSLISTANESCFELNSQDLEAIRVLGILTTIPMMPTFPIVSDIGSVMDYFAKFLSSVKQLQSRGVHKGLTTVTISACLTYLSRVVNSVPTNDIAILGDFFWVALSFLLSDNPQIYADALMMVDAVIASLWQRTSCPLETILSCYQRHHVVFGHSFQQILPHAHHNGLDMRDHLHFIVAKLLFKSVDHPDTTISQYTSRLLLRLNQPSLPSNIEKSKFSTIAYPLVAHIIAPDHLPRNSKRSARGSSVASSSGSHGNNAAANNHCQCWEDRLSMIEKLDDEQKLQCCQFLLSILVAAPKHSSPQQVILTSVTRLLRGCPNSETILDNISQLSEVRRQLADLLLHSVDSEVLIAAQGLLEQMNTATRSNSSTGVSSRELFDSLCKIPIDFATHSLMSPISTPRHSSNSQLSQSQSLMPSTTLYYQSVAKMIYDACILDCSSTTT